MKGDKRVLVVMTSHDALGTTGKKTGAFAAEVAHPVDVFVRHGYTVDFASIRGGVVPLDGVETDDASVKAFLADATLQARLHTAGVAEAMVEVAGH
jgi:putative intracellular protease/amidase